MTKKSAATQQIEALLSGGKKKKGAKQKGGGARKIGRYSKHPSSLRYRSEERWVANQIRRVVRHVKRLPGDLQARGWLARLEMSEIDGFLASTPIPKAA